MNPIPAKDYLALAKPKRRNKYGAVKTEIDGHTFDSKAEGRYYVYLKDRERKGEISGLELQRKFPLIVNDEHIGVYACDFAYWDLIEDRFRVVDVKGVETREFKRTKKLIKAIYGIEIEVVKG